MKYIEKVNEEMLKEYLYKHFDLNKEILIVKVDFNTNSWSVKYKAKLYGNVYYETLVFTDFNAKFKDNSLNEVANRCWQKFMYLKFGEKYLQDMEIYFKTINKNTFAKKLGALQDDYNSKNKEVDYIIDTIKQEADKDLKK